MLIDPVNPSQLYRPDYKPTPGFEPVAPEGLARTLIGPSAGPIDQGWSVGPHGPPAPDTLGEHSIPGPGCRRPRAG